MTRKIARLAVNGASHSRRAFGAKRGWLDRLLEILTVMLK